MNETKGILVTGGAGYIGSHAVLSLRERGERVVVIDNLSAGPPAAEFPGVTFVQGDIVDTGLIEKVINENQIDTILHFAAFIRVEESVREPEKYFANNTEGTRVLCEVAARCGVKDFIFSSSAAVYGSPAIVPVAEDSPTLPINPYGESKLRAERFVESTSMHFAILRYFNVAGADPHMRTGYRVEAKPTHLIRSCIRALLDGKVFFINGNDYPTPDGTCIRDYIHVSDLAEAHVSALKHLRSGGASRTFNCGDGRGYSNLQVVEAVRRVAGAALETSFAPRREGDPAMLIADSSRIQSELGWTPALGLEDMIKSELGWVRMKTQA